VLSLGLCSEGVVREKVGRALTAAARSELDVLGDRYVRGVHLTAVRTAMVFAVRGLLGGLR
jgi:hypothetical protein